MHGTLLALIVVIGALGFARRIPTNLASWIVVALTIVGIFTSADVVRHPLVARIVDAYDAARKSDAK